MALSLDNINLLSLLLLFLILPSTSQTYARPRSVVLPIIKDSKTLQYLAQLNQRTPLVPLKLTVDLGGQFLWVDCAGYVSSTYAPSHCNSFQCTLANSNNCIKECTYSSPMPGCYNNTCGLLPDNTVIGGVGSTGQLGQDVLSIPSAYTGLVYSVPKFLFICAKGYLLDSLASGVTGMAGLGRTNISLPSQFSAYFRFDRKFAVCLSPSTVSNGAIVFGNGVPGGIDTSKSLLYTPLLINPVSTATSYFGNESSSDYFIGVQSVKVNGKLIRFDSKLLSIDNQDFGGTKISTVYPYMVMATSIYNAVLEAFANEMPHIPRVKAVPPFGLCYNSSSINNTSHAGPDVPHIDLVFQRKSVYWRIYGANSMVKVSNDVMCLGIVNIGSKPRTSIVLGGHFIEDILLQFDIPHARLGFSNSLLLQNKSCSDINAKSMS
ncbi:hypothetical protein Tsubulata_006888 [Turnera subulata]|uniref:Peptidase A1 domain-containing protein n=1 Tax=Turnera subulata TaxID=218843 RepID=A0A9Q0JMY3_9ROSI|nr:hypothetical protein Tsubulata_006888 [Turnera subulata]